MVAIFLGTKKTYKVEIQLLVGYSERRGRDWLLRRPRSAPLNAFPFCSPQGPLQAQLRKKRQAVSFISIPSSSSALAPRYKKQKVSISRYLFAS